MNEIEKILEYITSNYDLLQKKLIVTINLKEFLTDDEFSEFTKYLSYKKIPLLLFEQRVHNTDDHNRTIIIDQDLCIL